MTIRHIKGKTNFTADWISRLRIIVARDPEVDDLHDPDCSPRECFEFVHRNLMGHHGVSRTMQFLRKYFPSYGLSQQIVAELVASCPHCHKICIGMDSKLVPMHRTLSQEHVYAAIGFDIVTATPPPPDKLKKKTSLSLSICSASTQLSILPHRMMFNTSHTHFSVFLHIWSVSALCG